MKNVLVPIGTNPDSYFTLQYAVDFAVEFSSKIFVMDVFKAPSKAGSLGNVSEKVAKNNLERIKEVIKKVDSKGVEIKMASYKGDIADGLIEIDGKLGIDLIIMAPRSNDAREELYLGPISGKIIKRTNIPTLVVPKGTTLMPMRTILTAFKSGILKRQRILNPLLAIKNKFEAKVNLLLVKTPGYSDDDLKIDTALMDMCSKMTITENPTTYLGVLEHFQTQKPDLLVVFRRKRGFFKKLWEKTEISKSEFSAPVPLLVLSVKKD